MLPDSNAEPGPYRVDRVPYWREVLRAFSDDTCDQVVAITASQSGKTETMFNVIGHRLDQGPRVPSLYIGPTQKLVRSISVDRISKMLRLTPRLYAGLARGNADSTYEKWVYSTRVGFAWAGSATELASHAAGLVLVDELDRMTDDIAGEGDAVALAAARTATYADAKVGIFTTPTIEGASKGWDMFDEGTLEFWCWRCKHCAASFVPRLELLRWPDKSTPEQAKENARVCCDKCGGEHETSDRQALNAAGHYIRHRKLDKSKSSAVFGQYVIDERPTAKSIRSFWVSGLCSPWAKQSFGALAAKYVRAVRSGRQERLQTEVNTQFGELFRMGGESPPWELVMSHRRDYAPGTLPAGVQLITCGMDPGKQGIYYVVRGWGYAMSSWLLSYGFIAGATAYDEVWLLASRVIAQRFDDMPIDRVFCDSGYRPGDKESTPENQVYRWCSRHIGAAFPTKGHDTLDRPQKANDIDVTIGGRLRRGGLKLWHLNTDFMKSTIYARWEWSESEQGEWQLHRETDEDYCRQVTNEQVRTTSSGRRQWIRTGDNHYLDCEVGALAAAMSLEVDALPSWASHLEARTIDERQLAQAGEQPAPFIDRPEGSFFR